MGQVVIVVRVIVGFLPRDLGRADLASFRRAVLVSDHIDLDGAAISHALELSGSSMLTLGFDSPHGLSRQLASFAAAAVGLALLAVVIAYLPTLYGTFSRREQLITKLTVEPAPRHQVRRCSPAPGVSPTGLLPLASLEQSLGARLRSGAGRRGAPAHGLRRAACLPRPAMSARRDPCPALDRRLPRHSTPSIGTRRRDPPPGGEVQ